MYTAADFELNERYVALVPNEKAALDRLQVRQNVFLVFFKNAAWALTSGGFRIVSDTFVNFVLLFAYFVSILAVLFFFLATM